MFKIQDLLVDEDFIALDTKLHNFNMFNVLKISDYEIRHTTYLAHLLDPFGTHGMGSKFLRNFLLHASRHVADEDVNHPLRDLEKLDLERTRVMAEISLDTDKSAVVDDIVDGSAARARRPSEGRLDILLQIPQRFDVANDVAIAIENKVYAREGIRQLERYQTWVSKRFSRHALLYLTLMDEACSPEWTGISYSNTVYPALEVTKQSAVHANGPGVVMMSHYMTTLLDLVESGASSADADLTAQKIHDKHPGAKITIDHLRAAWEAKIDGRPLHPSWGLYNRHKETFEFLSRYYQDDFSKILKWFSSKWPADVSAQGDLRISIDDSNRTMLRFLPVPLDSSLDLLSRRYARQPDENGKRAWTKGRNAVLFELRHDRRNPGALDAGLRRPNFGWTLHLVVGPLQSMDRFRLVERLRTLLLTTTKEFAGHFEPRLNNGALTDTFTTILTLILPNSATTPITSLMMSAEMLKILERIARDLETAFTSCGEPLTETAD